MFEEGNSAVIVVDDEGRQPYRRMLPVKISLWLKHMDEKIDWVVPVDLRLLID